jgi:hypothetical protein
MSWNDGQYYELPENPLRKGRAIILVPKRLLRSLTETHKIIGGVIGVLKRDHFLSEKFVNLVTRKASDIKITEIQDAILQEGSLLKGYLDFMDKKTIRPYDCKLDPLNLLAIEKYYDFANSLKPEGEVTSCDDLIKHIKKIVNIFKEHMGRMDGWKDMWKDLSIYNKPQIEASFGRCFRAIGLGYFDNFPEVTFETQSGTGNGPVDFKIIYKDCRVCIEIKRLLNSSAKGKPPLVSYIHGIKRQLPEYIVLSKAKYGFYITGQHWSASNKKRGNHDNRITEISKEIPIVKKEIIDQYPEFVDLFYENIDLSPKPTASEK